MATTVLRTFEIYQKARVQFVQTVAELANRKENYEALQSAGVLLLLRPLLLDVVPSVSQTACIAIGRMAENSAQVAQEIISLDILPDIVESIPQQNRFFKKCAAYVIRNIAMHNKHLAQEVVRAGGLNALGQILTEFDPSVKEAACWAISYIAKHNEELAGAVTEAITLKDLVLCIQEPELGLRQIACNALMQIARHKPELAKKVSDNETNLLPFLGPLIHHPSPKLQRQAIACLSHIAYHNQVLAEQVIQFIKVDKLLGNLKNDDAGVRINSAECIKNIVRHRAESGKIMSKDNAKPLIDYIAKYKGPAIEPALMAISCIATFDEILAMGIINSGAVPILKDRLTFDTDPTIKMRAAHALGCLGGFGEDHAREVANGGVLTEFKRIIYSETKKQEKRNVELLDVCKEANKKIISHCKHMDALYELIDNETQNDSLILVLKQILKILPNSNPAKKKFAESGGLEKLLIIKDQRERSVVASEKMDKTVESIIDDICKSYNNDDLINYYTPNFEQKIVAEKLDKLSQQTERASAFYEHEAEEAIHMILKNARHHLESALACLQTIGQKSSLVRSNHLVQEDLQGTITVLKVTIERYSSFEQQAVPQSLENDILKAFPRQVLTDYTNMVKQEETHHDGNSIFNMSRDRTREKATPEPSYLKPFRLTPNPEMRMTLRRPLTRAAKIAEFRLNSEEANGRKMLEERESFVSRSLYETERRGSSIESSGVGYRRVRGPYRKYTEEVKRYAIRVAHELKNDIAEASRKLKIPAKNIKRWINAGAIRKKGGRKTQDPHMETRLNNWIQGYISTYGRMPTNRDIKDRAMSHSAMPGFKASKGWLEKFLVRHSYNKRRTFVKLEPDSPRNDEPCFFVKTEDNYNSGRTEGVPEFGIPEYEVFH